MTGRKSLFLLFAASCTFCCEGYVWSGFQLAQKVSTTQLSAVKTLNIAREKLQGRSDLQSMKDEEKSLYSVFEQADEIEQRPPYPGQIIRGTVFGLDEFGAVVEIGGKTSGFLPIEEATLDPIEHISEVLELGQEVNAEVIGILKGTPVLSLRKEKVEEKWQEIIKLREVDASFDALILDVNRGGAVCSAYGLTAFLPGSHFVGLPDESLVGTTVKVKFLDISPEEGKIVVSQRRAMTYNDSEFKRGDIVSGTVSGLRVYGAFVELDNGITGLIHISQISYDRIDDLSQVFSLGQKVKAMVLDYDKSSTKLALSTKTLEPNPGDMIRDINSVFNQAEETARKYHERLEAERQAREIAAKNIVNELGDAIHDASGDNGDNLASAAVSIESILAAIVGDTAPADQSQ